MSRETATVPARDQVQHPSGAGLAAPAPELLATIAGLQQGGQVAFGLVAIHICFPGDTAAKALKDHPTRLARSSLFQSLRQLVRRTDRVLVCGKTCISSCWGPMSKARKL